MRVAIYMLKFRGGFHLGDVGTGTESIRPTIPADTLFSALLTSWIKLGGDPTCWTDAFPRTQNGVTEFADPPFLLTSAFPYAGGTLFFPKPLGLTLPDVPEDDRKRWKRVKFVSERIFSRFTKGEGLSEIWPKSEEQKKRQLKQGGAVLVLPDEDAPERIWREEKIPHVTIDRITSASNLYSVGRVSFSSNAGLWFAVNWRDPDRSCGDTTFAEAFKRSLEELKPIGLGGERSSGQGIFDLQEMDTLSWDDTVPRKPAVVLSRYHPRKNEIPRVLREALAYSLETVGGWGASPSGQFRRRSVTFLSEGSVITPPGNEVMGDLIDVAPTSISLGHPVWRYGLAFAISLGGVT